MANAGPRGGSEGEQVGSYKLIRKLGRGGMGEVWLGEHVTIKSHVAIKLVLAAPDDADAASRFLREAKATARIRHAGVVTVSDFGPREAGGAYLVMELLDGETLGDRLDRGALSNELAIDLGVQIAEALAAAHATGVVHRDLKPANIFLVRDAAARSDVRVKLVDFGVAKATGKVTDELGMTLTGALVGTPIYMAPEQCTSRKGSVDHRADLYALGVVLYEMVTGKPPFRGPTLGDLIDQHINETPVPPRTIAPSIPAKLDVLIVTLLAKEKADRPESANDVARTLHELRGTTPSPAGLDQTIASGEHQRPPRDGSVDATVDSGAVPGAMTQATGLGTPHPVGERIPAPALSVAAPRAETRRRMILIALGAVALAVLAVVLVMSRRSTKPPIDVATATAEQLETACRERHGAACDAVATREITTDKPDLSRVFAHRLAACDAKVNDACSAAAMMYFGGIGVRPDYARARKMAESACTDGSAYGCEIAGDITSLGGGGPGDRAAAFVQWKRGCDLGSASACASAARTIAYGLGVARDKAAADQLDARAKQLADANCAKNDPPSCRAIGHMYARGAGVEKDLARAATFLQRACELGEAEACGETGEFYAIGIGVAKNVDNAKRYLERGCNHGGGTACQTLAVATAHGFLGKAEPEAGFAIAKRTCETHGDLYCGTYADFFQMGMGTPKDSKQAAIIYERSCTQGSPSGCTSAATVQVNNVPVDEKKAMVLYTKACALGDGSGCNHLGKKARERKDFAKALEYLEVACAISDAVLGCDTLSRMLFRGEGTPKDPVRALKILVDSCDVSNSPIPCLILGIRYREGNEVPKNSATALHYFEKSCAMSIGEACFSVADLLTNDASGLARDERRAVVFLDKACQVEPRWCEMAPKDTPLGHEGLMKRKPGASEGSWFAP